MKASSFEMSRQRMVEEQLRGRGLKDQRVLEAMLRISREEFVPASLAEEAYEDYPLPIGSGQTISQPYIIALMIESLALKGRESVLEVGTGSGYEAAILACLGRKVYSIERVPKLINLAKENLQKINFSNIIIKAGDGSQGWPEFAPFQGIIVACAAEEVPSALVEQLAEGGRLIIPLGGRYIQELTLLEKKAGRVESKYICGCVFVPLISDKKEGKESDRG